jgi:two-component system, chemotaxis family, protein-glutamate methylesterase/glutaminase
MRKIRVLVVDDSVVARRMVVDALSQDPDIEVGDTAPNGQVALEKLRTASFDAVTLDIEMPIMNGLTTLREIRKVNRTLPVIIFSSLTVPSAKATLRALTLGASDYVAKPSGTMGSNAARDIVRTQLVSKFRTFCGRPKISSAATATPPAPVTPARPWSAGTRRPSVLAIGVSTGGPEALGVIIPKIPATFPVPILIVQHMPPVFTDLLAKSLASRSNIPVREATHGEQVLPGRAYLAPGDHHMTVAKRGGQHVLQTNQAQPENSCRPAVDVLFRSVDEVYGARTLAVILTGMGYDGLKGCEQLHEKGAHIMAQDEASSVVWGMPGAVAKAGIAHKIVPLDRVTDEILGVVR